ncbi:MAG: LysM domain-containing protein [Bacteroidales bacterium]
MKINIVLLIFSFFLCLEYPSVQAQNTDFIASPIEISTYTDTLNGQVFLVHTVLRGHTLYSIAKTYKCHYQDIRKDSPDTEVKIGEALYIPFHKSLFSNKETPVWKAFTGIKPQILERESPNASVTLLEEPISIEEVEEKLDNQKIPTKTPVPVKAKTVKIERKAHKDTLNISLMLPLYSYEALSLDSIASASNGSSKPTFIKSYIYLPFYEGASLAWAQEIQELQELQESSASPTESPVFNLNLYDVTEAPSSLSKALKDPALASSDVIISAIFAQEFNTLQAFASKHKIPLVHPISERDSMANNFAYFLQFTPSFSTQMKLLADYIKSDHPHSKYLLLSDSNPNNLKKALQLKSHLPKSKLLTINSFAYKTLASLPRDSSYVLCGFTDKEILLLNTFIALRRCPASVTLIGPSKWTNFDKIEFDFFLKNRFTSYANFYADRNDSNIRDFEKDFYHWYHTAPNDLAYQGYLCMRWILSALKTYNTDFMYYAPSIETNDFPFNQFNFQMRLGGNGLENQKIRIFKLGRSGYTEILKK